MKKYLHKKNLREYFFFSLDYVRIIAHGEGVSVFRTGRKHYSTVGAFQPIGSALRPNKRRFRRYTIFEFPVKCNLPAGFFFFFFFLLLSIWGEGDNTEPMSFTVSSILRGAAACKTRGERIRNVFRPGPRAILRPPENN